MPRPESKPATPSSLFPTLKTEEPSLSDLNPLFNPLDLPSPSSVDAFKTVTLALIDRYGGLSPDFTKSLVVVADDPKAQPEYRFIARFEVANLTRSKIHHLEELVRYVYGSNARTMRNSDGIELPAVKYPPSDTRSVDDIVNTRFEGWYMGPNTTALSALHKGLYLFRDVGVTNAKNFLKTSQAKKPRFIVEIREGDMFQTDLANLVVETGSILGRGSPVDYGQLLYDAYYDLMRVGLKRQEEGYDIEAILGPIRRGLILPLASPRLADGITQEPESALLAGVPGTGKSLAARQLFYLDTGLFIVPMDPNQLADDTAKTPDKRVLLPRIAQVRTLSQRPVVLQLDDVEKVFSKDNKSSPTFLNLMAGVQEQGFYVLASTNEPEKIDEALLQPQRLGTRVYCGLPSEQARLQILKMHTPMFTEEDKIPLFSTPEVRDLILIYVARNIDSFPPRQLAKIATNAKSLLLERVAGQKGKVRGLSEADLNGITFTVDDWEEALNQTLETFDKAGTVKRDEAIREFIVHHEKEPFGFKGTQTEHSSSFDEVRRQVAALELHPAIG